MRPDQCQEAAAAPEPAADGWVALGRPPLAPTHADHCPAEGTELPGVSITMVPGRRRDARTCVANRTRRGQPGEGRPRHVHVVEARDLEIERSTGSSLHARSETAGGRLEAGNKP